MKNSILLFIVLICSCSSSKQNIHSRDYSITERKQIQKILTTVLDSVSQQRKDLPKSFYPEFQEVNPEHYWNKLIRPEFPSTPDSVFQLALQDVKIDFLSGEYIFKSYGLGTIYTDEKGRNWDNQRVTQDIFREKYGVIIDPIAGDLVNGQLTLYAKTYNSVSKTVMNKFYQIDITKTVWESVPSIVKKEGQKRPEWKYEGTW